MQRRRGCEPFIRLASLLRFVLTLLILVHGISLYAEEHSYLSSLLLAAREKQLWKDPFWHTLLHYKQTLFGLQSQVDDPRFFLSPKGKSDPQAELEATLKSFFPHEKDPSPNPLCRFIARYDWLAHNLDIEPSRLPVPLCSRFADIIGQINPKTATLIFPAAHINSPASMFGHTLLTVDTESGSRLLAHAINYSAVTKETFGPLFAVKGLFGLYPGYFSILPYYAKLQEYSDIEHRDIWEYPLNLNRDEITRLLMHVYEMDAISSDYYFFDENCSYELLFLLDAARQGTGLTDRFSFWVIPIDTIRKVRDQGLITEAIYRPSKASKIRYLASLLSRDQAQIARKLALGEREPNHLLQEDMAPKTKILISDLAGEYLQYQYSKKKVDVSVFQQRFWKILRVRSALGGHQEGYRIPPPARPEEGHLSNRLRMGLGVSEGRLFEEVAFRPAYHDLLDDDRGYVEGSQIVFTDAALRFYSSDHRLRLQKFDFLDIVSLSPRDAFFQPYSWKIKTGLLQRTGQDEEDHLAYQLNGGGGVTFRPHERNLLYLLGEADLVLSGGLGQGYALGMGASGGMISKVTKQWKIHLFAREIFYLLGTSHTLWEAALHQDIVLGRNTSLRLETGVSTVHGHERTEASLWWNVYF